MFIKKAALCLAVVLLAASPAAAQNAPMAGPAGDPLQFWQGRSIGTYVIVGGLVFVVTLGGLQLLGGDDSTPAPSPAPPATGSTTSTN